MTTLKDGGFDTTFYLGQRYTYRIILDTKQVAVLARANSLQSCPVYLDGEEINVKQLPTT